MKHLPRIILEVVPHNEQNYETAGDYFKSGKNWKIRTSKINADMEFLILFHEFIEWYLTQKRGISEPDIAKFDKEFEQNRKRGNVDEPGDDVNAPYYNEHQIATWFEKEMSG